MRAIRGSPLWVAKNVYQILGIKQAVAAVRKLDDDEKGLRSMSTPGGMRDLSVVNEWGL